MKCRTRVIHSFLSLIHSLTSPSFSTCWPLIAANCIFQTWPHLSVYPTPRAFPTVWLFLLPPRSVYSPWLWIHMWGHINQQNSDAIWLPILGHRNDIVSSCLSLFLLGCWSLALRHHIERKPRLHGSAQLVLTSHGEWSFDSSRLKLRPQILWTRCPCCAKFLTSGNLQTDP